MKLTKKLAFAVPAALAVAGGASGTAAADTETNILNCNIIEVVDARLISGAPNNIDCSTEYDKTEVSLAKLIGK